MILVQYFKDYWSEYKIFKGVIMSVPTTFKRKVITYFILILVAFLLGFVPMGLNSYKHSRNLSKVENQLNLVRIENALASSAIDARRGDYESARQAVSNFYTSLQSDTDKGKNSSFTQVQRESIKQLINNRDEIITLIARSDPASADRLSDLFVSYREIMNNKEGIE
jgi:hypothetical protein